MQDRELRQTADRAGFQLKGSGWYATDFKGGGSKPTEAAKSDNPPPCQGGTGSCAANTLTSALKKYFITGLLIWVPLVITAWVLSLIVRSMDQSLLLLPQAIHPEHLLGIYIPGLGALLTLLVVFLTGLVTTNIIGQKLVRFWEGVLARIPVVKSIYYSVKQVSDTLFSGSGDAFRKVLLVRYPHPEAWAVAFQTGHPARDVADHAAGRTRRRLHSDHAQPGQRLLLFRQAQRRHRTRHERR